MVNDEMSAILNYLAKQGEGSAKTVREITDGTGLTSLVVRKKLAKSAKDSVPLVEIGKTGDNLDGYKLTSYGMASLDDAPAAAPVKKAAKKPAASTRKAASKKVSSGPVTVERSDSNVVEHKIAAYLVKEGKKKPVFRIAQDISENQDDVEKALAKMDSESTLASELMADFNERVYQANDATKELANSKPQVVESQEKVKEPSADISSVDEIVVKILKKEKELAGKPLVSAVSAKAKGLSSSQVEQRIEQLVGEGVLTSKPKGRGKTYYLPSTASVSEPAAVKRAAKKTTAPSVARKPAPKQEPDHSATAGSGQALGSEMESLMGMLQKSMENDLTSAGPHASEALEKVREYMTQLENEVNGWRKLASTFVTGAKGIVD